VLLTTLDWPIIAAWAAVLVAFGGSVYAGQQARSAKESLRLAREAKDIALDQAHSARDSAESARVAKVATVDQARSARDSVEVARAALHRADRPRFEITADPRQTDKVPVTVKMLDGPPALNVEVSWISESSWPIANTARSVRLHAGTGLGLYDLVLNDKIGFSADVPLESERGDVKVILECTEVGGEERKWPHVEVVEWERISPQVY